MQKIWLAEFETPHEYINYFLEAMEQFANGIRAYETYEDSGIWVISLSFWEQKDIKQQLTPLCNAIGYAVPQITMREIDNKNWVEELSRNFQPISAGEFYIYSEFSHPSADLINIKINPGMAFGTGQHETTFLCLEAISAMQDAPKNILDLGCGSGILAIAAHKKWPNANIIAADNDAVAVKVAIENIKMNNSKISAMVSEGFKDITQQKFDMIFANILMNPLLEMVSDMANFSSGKIILSGFKTEQTERIVEAYSALGFSLERVFVKNFWVAACLRLV